VAGLSDVAHERQPPLPRSPWTERAPAAPETPPLEGEAEADVAIVGGGFTGLSTALHLAGRGVSVALLEAMEPGYGASGRNGGQVIAGLKLTPDELRARFGAERGEAIAAFAGAAPDVIFELIERHRIECDAVRGGWLQGIHARAALPAAEDRLRQAEARGWPVELLDAKATARLTGSEGYAAGLLDRRGGTLNPLAYARGLARAALGAGARLHARTPALSLERRGGRWRITTPAGAVTAERVLLATNAYSGDLWPGLRRSVIPAFSYQVATAPMGGNLRRRIMPGGLGLSDTRRVLSYCRQDPDGRLLVGGRGRFRESQDRADYAPVIARLKRLFPEAGELAIDHFWGGKVALTLDHTPHIAEPAPGLAVAAGFNGRGVALTSAVGRAMADHLTGTPLGELPLPVRPMRPIPFHGLRIPAMAGAIWLKRAQDWWEARRG
jgi:glycine/D-amino acid oxidase-like deaminating enzyme